MSVFQVERCVSGQEPGPEGVCLGPAVVRGFLTSGKKDFTTQFHLTIRMHSLKLGTMKQGRA